MAVALPPETPPQAAEVLLIACDQAYVDGDCELTTPSQPVDSLPARVRWLTPTVAELTLDLSSWRNTRPSETRLTFSVEDEPLERHRALGFALGTLAGQAVGSSKPSPTPTPGPQEDKAQGDEPPKPPAEAAPKPPEPPPPRPKPTPIVILEEPAVREPSRPLVWSGGAGLGVLLGTGVDTIRYGATLAGQLNFSRRWTVALAGAVAQEPVTSTSLETYYLQALALLGVRTALGPVRVDWLAGAVLDYRHIRHVPSNTAESRLPLGPALSVQLQRDGSGWSPWLTVTGTLQRELSVVVEGQTSTLGSFNILVAAGAHFESL